MNTLELKKIANEVRKGIIEGVYNAKAGHPGGSLSSADFFTYLYFEEMNVDPKNPKKEDRDRFVLSKGHVSTEGILPSRRFKDSSSYRFLFTRTSRYETYSWS